MTKDQQLNFQLLITENGGAAIRMICKLKKKKTIVN